MLETFTDRLIAYWEGEGHIRKCAVYLAGLTNVDSDKADVVHHCLTECLDA